MADETDEGGDKGADVIPIERARKPEDEFAAAVVEKHLRRIATDIVNKRSERGRADDSARPDWWQSVRRNDQNTATKHPDNATIILCNHPVWRGVLEWDDFSARALWTKSPPVVDHYPVSPAQGAEVSEDGDVGYIRHWLALEYGPTFAQEAVSLAMVVAAKANRYHPVKRYLESLAWDRVPRLDHWLETYLGATNEGITSQIGVWWMVSAVARIYEPGCQADHMLLLEGPQGIGKSQALQLLAGAWFLPSLPDLRDKDSLHVLLGRWIVAVNELDAFRAQATSKIKDFLTRGTDIFRPPYGRSPMRFQRSCVFAGTTNDAQPLQDFSGGRRFWPVACGQIDRDGLARDRDQLWAEALCLYRTGTKWYPAREDNTVLAELQDARYQHDEWELIVTAWLSTRLDAEITMGDVLGQALSIPPERWDRAAQVRVGYCLARNGWRRRRVRRENKLVYTYRRSWDPRDVSDGSQLADRPGYGD